LLLRPNDVKSLQVDAGNLQVRGCEFQSPGVQLMIANNAKKVIFADNLITGPLNVTQANGAKFASANNLAD
jgi:acyl CoA:acetate/3-ketoacid CoA transferase